MGNEAKQRDHDKLIDALAKTKFADEYYSLCEAFTETGAALPLEQQRAAMEATGREAKYDNKEKFFAYRETSPPTGCSELGLNITVRGSSLELILVATTKGGRIGGPLAGIAKEVKESVDPDFERTPPYPTPKFANQESLQKALAKGFALYDKVAKAIAHADWA